MFTLQEWRQEFKSAGPISSMAPPFLELIHQLIMIVKMHPFEFSKRACLKTMRQSNRGRYPIYYLDFIWTCMEGHTHKLVWIQCTQKQIYIYIYIPKKEKKEMPRKISSFLKKIKMFWCFIWTFLNNFHFKWAVNVH